MDQKFPFLVADPKSTVESADAIVELPCMSPHFFDVGLSSNVFAKAFANSILLVVICQVAFLGGTSRTIHCAFTRNTLLKFLLLIEFHYKNIMLNYSNVSLLLTPSIVCWFRDWCFQTAHQKQNKNTLYSFNPIQVMQDDPECQDCLIQLEYKGCIYNFLGE